MQVATLGSPLVRTARAEDVADVTAGADLERPTAHPDLNIHHVHV